MTAVPLTTIRTATTADAPGIAVMVDLVWRQTYKELVDESFWATYPLETRTMELRVLLQNPAQGQRSLVACADEEVVGWVTCGPSRAPLAGIPAARERELTSLYVGVPGGGLGQRLLDAALGEGVPAELWVFEGNVAAQRFYARNGFRPEGARHVYRPETAALPEVRWVR